MADLMVPIDLAEVLKFIRKDSFSIKELLDQNFQLESLVAAADYMRPELFENQTILDEIIGNVEYANATDEDFPFFCGRESDSHDTKFVGGYQILTCCTDYEEEIPQDQED
ncbi:hypothetical protein PDJ84_25985 [Bacillus cereus]|uniref:hypothetical protein n=1 Tax=Bacillus cereus group TaxID=86661 RepID=UPI001F466D55|nr:hypothetical protein [Bacillus cereus]MDA1521395.1 hypothetical protein [Bacillus cereus]